MAGITGVGGFVIINIGFTVPLLRGTEEFDPYRGYVVLLGLLLWVVTGLCYWVDHKFFERKETK